MGCGCILPLPIAHCPLPIAHCPLPIAHCPLPIAHCPLPIAHCPLPIAHCPLPIAHCRPLRASGEALIAPSWRPQPSEDADSQRPIDRARATHPGQMLCPLLEVLTEGQSAIAGGWLSRFACRQQSALSLCFGGGAASWESGVHGEVAPLWSCFARAT